MIRSQKAWILRDENLEMRLTIRQDPDKNDKLARTLWAFVTNRMTIEDFEPFVYDNMEELETIFTAEAVSALVELNYRKVRPDALRQDVKNAIEGLPLPCECPKIPRAVEMDIGFLNHIGDSRSLIDYVDNRVLRAFALERTDESACGYWQYQRPGMVGPLVYLQEARFYECKECETRWLVVLDESTVAYLFVEISADVSGIAGRSQLEKTLGDKLGYWRCKR